MVIIIKFYRGTPVVMIPLVLCLLILLSYIHSTQSVLVCRSILLPGGDCVPYERASPEDHAFHKQRVIEYLIRVDYEPPNKASVFVPEPSLVKLGDFFLSERERRVISHMEVETRYINESLVVSYTHMLVYNQNVSYRWIVYQTSMARFSESGLVKTLYVEEQEGRREYVGEMTVFGDRWLNYRREVFLLGLIFSIIFMVYLVNVGPPSPSGDNDEEEEVYEYSSSTSTDETTINLS